MQINLILILSYVCATSLLILLESKTKFTIVHFIMALLGWSIIVLNPEKMFVILFAAVMIGINSRLVYLNVKNKNKKIFGLAISNIIAAICVLVIYRKQESIKLDPSPYREPSPSREPSPYREPVIWSWSLENCKNVVQNFRNTGITREEFYTPSNELLTYFKCVEALVINDLQNRYINNQLVKPDSGYKKLFLDRLFTSNDLNDPKKNSDFVANRYTILEKRAIHDFIPKGFDDWSNGILSMI